MGGGQSRTYRQDWLLAEAPAKSAVSLGSGEAVVELLVVVNTNADLEC